MARLSRRLWGGTSLKTAAKEANPNPMVNPMQICACAGNYFIYDTV